MDIEALKALYGTDKKEDVIKAKTETRQEKAFSPRKPKRVEMTAAECKKLCKSVGLEYLEGYEARVVEHVVTDETVDRYGDIVRAAGVDFKTNYQKNPTIQYAHDYKQPPIGKSIKIWNDKEEKNVKSWGLYFDDRIDKTGLSDTIFKFIVAGAMPACSIGFDPIKVNNPRKAEERTEIGLGEWGVEFIKSDMLEYSPCSIGANPNALQNSIKSMMLTRKNFDKIKELSLVPEDMYAGILETIEKAIDNDPEFDINKVVPDDKEYEEIKTSDNEHATRLSSPDMYDKFRNSLRKSDDKTYSVISGKKKSDGKWEEHAYRYNNDLWTAKEARKHSRENDGIVFEPANGKSERFFDDDSFEVKFVEAMESFKDVYEKTIVSNTEVIEKLNEIGKQIGNLNITLTPDKDSPPAGGDLDKDTFKSILGETFSKPLFGEGDN